MPEKNWRRSRVRIWCHRKCFGQINKERTSCALLRQSVFPYTKESQSVVRYIMVDNKILAYYSNRRNYDRYYIKHRYCCV